VLHRPQENAKLAEEQRMMQEEVDLCPQQAYRTENLFDQQDVQIAVV
jgi:hypothetical protein